MSIGNYIPSIGEQFIFLGIDSKDNFLGDWRKEGKLVGKLVKIDGVVLVATHFPFEISPVNTNEFIGDKSMAVDGYELTFLEAKPLEFWE